jgi:hypothetical protein
VKDHCKLQPNWQKQNIDEREIIARFSTIGKSKTVERRYNRKLATTARVNNKIIGKNNCKR